MAKRTSVFLTTTVPNLYGHEFLPWSAGVRNYHYQINTFYLNNFE